jgi:oligoendopeptidase F
VQEIFADVYEKYGYQEYDGFQQEWMDQIHNFEQPMYYISYAASALPALELFARQQADPGEAMDAYLRVASMSDEDYYLSDAVKEAGLSDIFADGTGAKVASALEASGALKAG